MREESDEGWTNSVGKRMVHAASDGEVGGCAGDSRVEKKISRVQEMRDVR